MSIRKFQVFTEPNIADPHWEIRVIENREEEGDSRVLNEDGMISILNRMKFRKAYEEGRQEGVSETLEVLGINFDEYVKKYVEFRKARDLHAKVRTSNR